jgi:hypothetical protein
MGDETYYFREAQRCRDFASTTADPKAAQRWNRLADDYAILAEELDAYIHHRTPLLQMPLRLHEQHSKAGR